MMFKKRSILGARAVQGNKALPTITIHNMNVEKPFQVFDVRCDRESVLGNRPQVNIAREDPRWRDAACDWYDHWFNTEVLTFNNWPAYEELMRLREIYRKHGRLRVFCWCVSKRCHTETIVKWLRANP